MSDPVRDAIRALKELLAMVKRKLREPDGHDPKQAADVQHALKQAEQAAQALDGGAQVAVSA
ncbi:hypothetical protein [Achromobacter deleyi]|uniref:hypothetical protein n=1 Tax=Achromobacter deleyi TaxID=1353891 RepID=UPI00158355C9|nr:hypothetical protein [Achromobacter deleyi]